MAVYQFMFLVAFAMASCPSYQCGNLTTNECVSYNSTNNTYLFQQCPASASYCNIPTTSFTSVNCSVNASSYINYAGEYCATSANCYNSAACSNSVCTGKAQNASCSTGLDCGAGLYCSTSANSTCQPQKTVGESCVYDADCVNTAGCMTNSTGSGICTNYFSLANGVNVSSCSGHINMFCSSSVCVQNNNGAYTCIKAPATLASLPVTCSGSSSPCVSTAISGYAETSITQACECGYNANGTSYCNLNPGDPLYQTYLGYLQQWYNSTSVTSCNSERKASFPCIQAQWSLASQITYYYYAAMSYPLQQNSPVCVTSVYNYTLYTPASSSLFGMSAWLVLPAFLSMLLVST